MIRIAIIDDDAVFSDLLAKSIESLRPSWNIEVHNNYVQKKSYDAYFLDIEFCGKNDGFLIAENIWKFQENIPVIFISSHNELVCEGYKYHALRFIRKQYYNQELEESLNALDKIFLYQQSYIEVRNCTDNDKCQLFFSDIQYLYTDGNYLTFLDKDDKEYRTRITLKRFSEDYHSQMLKVSSGAMVNPAYIKKIDRDNLKLILSTDKKILISQHNLTTILRAYVMIKRMNIK